MSRYSDNVKFCGSHAGVSIGEDGALQMGSRTSRCSDGADSVAYPADAVATGKLVGAAARHRRIVT
jgi:transketolase